MHCIHSRALELWSSNCCNFCNIEIDLGGCGALRRVLICYSTLSSIPYASRPLVFCWAFFDCEIFAVFALPTGYTSSCSNTQNTSRHDHEKGYPVQSLRVQIDMGTHVYLWGGKQARDNKATTGVSRMDRVGRRDTMRLVCLTRERKGRWHSPQGKSPPRLSSCTCCCCCCCCFCKYPVEGASRPRAKDAGCRYYSRSHHHVLLIPVCVLCGHEGSKHTQQKLTTNVLFECCAGGKLWCVNCGLKATSRRRGDDIDRCCE